MDPTVTLLFTLFFHSYSFCGSHLGEPGSGDDHHSFVRKFQKLQKICLPLLGKFTSKYALWKTRLTLMLGASTSKVQLEVFCKN